MKRFGAILLAFLFLSTSLGLLSACGKKEEQPATPETVTAPAPPEEEEKGLAEEAEPAELPTP